MANSSEQLMRKTAGQEEEKKEAVQSELPMESSPYLKYTDLEDYKSNAYGCEGHLPVNPNQGGGATDAPTLSSSASLPHGKTGAADAGNRRSVP